jgi:hypothetical protein
LPAGPHDISSHHGSDWCLSMDIGQAVDPSAITLVEKIENPGMAELTP